MANLYIMVGLPGSGKTTIAYEIKENQRGFKGYVVSTDKIREEITGSETSQDKNTEVFETAYKRLKFGLENGFDMIFDATNINYKRRIDVINKFKKYADEIVCCFVYAPYEECLERNKNRERQVPKDVIKRMYMNFYVPQYFEGFDKIKLYYNSNKIFDEYTVIGELEDKLSIPHNNPHHKLSILEHSIKAREYMAGIHTSIPDIVAAWLHDIGKPFCKTFINAKGETTDVAHYYGHEKVGAYDSLYYSHNFDLKYQLYIAQLIQWHMLLHDPNLTEKTIKKHKDRMGEEFWYNLELLHKADLAAN